MNGQNIITSLIIGGIVYFAFIGICFDSDVTTFITKYVNENNLSSAYYRKKKIISVNKIHKDWKIGLLFKYVRTINVSHTLMSLYSSNATQMA